MTNVDIIMAERLELMKQGKIGTTGRVFTMTDSAGAEIRVPEPEEIHTFAAWKSAGFAVRKGEKAIAKFPVWKYTSKVVENDDGEEEEHGRMYMKTAAFFARSQVDPIAA